MSILTANDAPVLAGSMLTTPSAGLWTAQLRVDSLEEVGPKVTLKSFDGKLSLVGTAKREAMLADARTMFVVAGAGGLGDTMVTKKGYQSISVRVVISEILSAAGEKLSSSSDTALLGKVLRHWTRFAGTAMNALDRIVNYLATTWRALPDGTIYIGKLAYPEATDETASLQDQNEADGFFELHVEAPRFLAPCTFEGRQIDNVVHALGDVTTTWLHFSGSSIRDMFRAAVRKALPELDYFARYSAKVLDQNADLSLELLPDDARIPNKSKVPIRYGFAGLKTEVLRGARCMLGWDAGDPDKPYASDFEEGSLKRVTIEASVEVVVKAPDVVTQDGRPLARIGDMVQVVASAPGTIAVGQIITANNHHRG